MFGYILTFDYLCNVVLELQRRQQVKTGGLVMNTKKSLNEQIADVMNMNASNNVKRNELIKLGLDATEVYLLLTSKAWQSSGFDFSKLTFGVEIECTNVMRNDLIINGTRKGLSVRSEGYNHADNQHYYKIVSDSSLEGVNTNEVVSPILQGNDGLNSLKRLCEALNEIGAKVNKSCGLHVHIGAANMTDAHYTNIIRNYQRLESIIDSFMPESRRGNNSRWCRSLRGFDFSCCTTKDSVCRTMNGDRYHKVNACAYFRHQTIEFRQHSGTTDYTKISMWIQFLAELIKYSEKNEITSCNSIDEIPFLNAEQKAYFNNRRACLN